MWTSTKSRFDFELIRELRKNGTKWAARALPEGGREGDQPVSVVAQFTPPRLAPGAQDLTDDSTIGDGASNGRASRGESNIGIRRTPSSTQERNIPALR